MALGVRCQLHQDLAEEAARHGVFGSSNIKLRLVSLSLFSLFSFLPFAALSSNYMLFKSLSHDYLSSINFLAEIIHDC